MDNDEYYKCLFDNAFEPILLIDGHYFIDGNNAALKILGMSSKEELRVIHPKQISPEYQPDGRSSEEKANAMINTCYKKGYHQFEWVHKRLDGKEFLVEVTLKIIKIGDRELMHTTWRELEKEKAFHASIRKKNHLLEEKNKLITEVKNILKSNDENAIFEKLNLCDEYKRVLDESSIVLKADHKGAITYVNDRFCEISGYTKKELINKNHSVVLHPDISEEFSKKVWSVISKKKTYKGIVKSLTKDKKTYYADSTIMPLLDHNGNIIEYISIRHDITQLYKKDAIIIEQFTDGLTKLPNRVKLIKDIQTSVEPKLAIFNIDRFKDINESYSLQFGDKLLKEFATKLRSFESVNLKVYRINADFFALLGCGNISLDNISEKCSSFINKIERNVLSIDGIDLELSITAGIAVGKEKILTHAEMAYLYAKRHNKSYAIFDKNLPIYKELLNNIKTTKNIKTALKNDKIIAYAQKIISNKGGQEKYETLMRIRLENGDLLSPAFFLEQAKKAKLYPALSRNMIEKSLNFFKDKDHNFTMNLMIEDITNEKTIEFLFKKLKETNTSKRLTIEIVETEGIEKYCEVESFISRAKEIGCKIAIDDFGTGYSNFEYIINLNIDILKIDGSLIKNIHIDKNTFLTVRTIVAFARVLDVCVVAEFVHCQEVQNIIEDLNIEYSQGYLFHEPEELTPDLNLFK
ncbi:EAL domain-containing protein [Neptuniibacter sp. PT34_22]|uniref:bifunctional diguanylate cyclase/phosphodiesterase n=1 Tax=Neptuniibacter sp. PT34_22 TaxID=3398205 RepID=UPI0039F5F61A